MRYALWLASLAVISSSFAQTASDSLDGKWTATWTTDNGTERQAYVEITGAAGTWKNVPIVRRGKPDPCITTPAPVAVETASNLTTLFIKRSEALAGCKDQRVTLNAPSAGKIEGTFFEGKPVTLTRR